MKRFSFPFEALGRLRRRRREACELALAERRAARARQLEARSALAEAREEAEADWQAVLSVPGRLDVAAAASRRAYLGVLSARIEDLEAAIAHTNREIEERRLALVEASRAEKVVERLKERRREAWARASDREESSFLGDMALVPFHRAGVRA